MIIDNFMTKYFILLPSDLQVKIMLSVREFYQTIPKFKRDEYVKFKMSVIYDMRRARFNNYCNNFFFSGEMPIYFLKICHEPIWDKRKKIWYYYYRYGYDYQEYGCADENQLLRCVALTIR